MPPAETTEGGETDEGPGVSLLKEESECETVERENRKQLTALTDKTYTDTEDDTEMSELENNTSSEKIRSKRQKHRGTSRSLPHPCPQCQMRFLFPNKLRLHIESKHSKKHECANCGEKFDIFEELRKHWAVSHVKIYQCEHCDYKHRKKSQLSRHIRKQHEQGVKCPIAGCMATMSAWRMGGHLSRCHAEIKSSKVSTHFEEANITPIVHQCEWCNYSTLEAKAYEYHLDGEHGDGIVCPISSCQMRMVLSKLNNHMETYHFDDDVGTSCNNNQLQTQMPLKQTIWSEEEPNGQTLSSTKPIPIPLPSDVQEVLLQNMKGSLLCDECNKSFNTKASLRKHVARVHEKRYAERTDKKAYTCTFEDCEKIFKSIAQLKDHENQHTGERPHACPKCKSAFTARLHLGKHLRRVHMFSLKALSQMERTIGLQQDK